MDKLLPYFIKTFYIIHFFLCCNITNFASAKDGDYESYTVDTCFKFPIYWEEDYGHPLNITLQIPKCQLLGKVINITGGRFIRPQRKGDKCSEEKCCLTDYDHCIADIQVHFPDRFRRIHSTCDGKTGCNVTIGSVAMDDFCPQYDSFDCKTSSRYWLFRGSNSWCWARRVEIDYTCVAKTKTESSTIVMYTLENSTAALKVDKSNGSSISIIAVTVTVVVLVVLCSIIISVVLVCFVRYRRKKNIPHIKERKSDVPLHKSKRETVACEEYEAIETENNSKHPINDEMKHSKDETKINVSETETGQQNDIDGKEKDAATGPVDAYANVPGSKLSPYEGLDNMTRTPKEDIYANDYMPIGAFSS